MCHMRNFFFFYKKMFQKIIGYKTRIVHIVARGKLGNSAEMNSALVKRFNQ